MEKKITVVQMRYNQGVYENGSAGWCESGTEGVDVAQMEVCRPGMMWA